MGLKDLFTKKTIVTKTMIETTTTTEEKVVKDDTEQKALEKIAPEKIGVLDMVIAFDTTGSMAAYIEAVRHEVAELIPNLFKDNEDLRLGIVAFGDYCDMNNAQDFGDAYQCLMPTNNENDIIKFVRESKDTSGGDGDEFYELVIKKIVEETPWREGSTRAILLISDADPHPLGYTYKDYVVGNQIDWRKEAQKAAEMKIKIDTVTIRETEWYKELSQMTNGISVPFASGHKTARLVEAATNARGSIKARMKFDKLYNSCVDDECLSVFASYQAEREKVEE
ncbi:MAG: VWA domain-containing protein [Bacteroidaceae bacterium]|nr:VWA domain-containing protein [Bacteroidaceae bacterium]